MYRSRKRLAAARAAVFQAFFQLLISGEQLPDGLMHPVYSMIQLLPSSYHQMRTCTLNYETLMNIYYARRNHKLDEWHTVCDWIASLPYAKELILAVEEK